MATRHTPDFWQTHLTAWQQTKLTVTAYCTQHGLCAKTFYRWRSQLTTAPNLTRQPPLTLIPVSVQPAPVTGTLQLHSPTGWRVELPIASTPWLIDLLRQLP
ncbi:IS66 family insertion sequence element accessory protein TnpA [Sulfuriferula nivalis]|uniref:IS66 family insertion sequence element accessory protein TnpA n=1 Tax=Sulfuriferula nivalis TaxID=2675298 RepID=UPI00138A5D32|nr:IS66 family insertion sequence element accessory protein TnpB [Sulfuriferula nivalis]